MSYLRNMSQPVLREHPQKTNKQTTTKNYQMSVEKDPLNLKRLPSFMAIYVVSVKKITSVVNLFIRITFCLTKKGILADSPHGQDGRSAQGARRTVGRLGMEVAEVEMFQT